MKPNETPRIDRRELEASLKRLGIRELEERMEVSPLLTDAGIEGTDHVDPGICCTCKIPNPFDPDGNLPYPQMAPTPTGPTNPTGFD